eukprot:1397059-Rhodomonas_salina.5
MRRSRGRRIVNILIVFTPEGIVTSQEEQARLGPSLSSAHSLRLAHRTMAVQRRSLCHEGTRKKATERRSKDGMGESRSREWRTGAKEEE